ncbi:MAG: hypothetical protein AAFY27_05170, partial [Pseudomonadota bacterium]
MPRHERWRLGLRKKYGLETGDVVLGLAFRLGHRAADVVATFALNIRPSNVFDGVQRPRNEHLF